jgi:hypothetical protein
MRSSPSGWPDHCKHVGILAHSTEGAALCFLAFCQEGFRRLGRNEHPDVTLDYIETRPWRTAIVAAA